MTVPNSATTLGRVRVSCVGNVFVDISNANLFVQPILLADDFETGTTVAWLAGP